MEQQNTNAGHELLNLLRQQRYLYHELGLLTVRKQQLGETDSPELALEIINAKRKLVEKLREINNKLRPIRAKWQKLLLQIEPVQMAKANKLAEEVKQIVARISTVNKRSAVQSSRSEAPKSNKFLAEVYS